MFLIVVPFMTFVLLWVGVILSKPQLEFGRMCSCWEILHNRGSITDYC